MLHNLKLDFMLELNDPIRPPSIGNSSVNNIIPIDAKIS